MIRLLILLAMIALAKNCPAYEDRPRARDLGIEPGILSPGPLNAITDVDGVAVGHSTVIEGASVRTGVTAVLPHGGNLYQEKVPAAVVVGNGFGKLMGATQIRELGEIETPVLLTSTLNVPRVADALIDWMIRLDGNENVRSVNCVVGETNDGFLNDIRGRHVTGRHVFAALQNATTGAVAEGSIGAGTGTVAFGFKGGIGTASRVLPPAAGGYTLGVLVQSNFGGILSVNGAPVGRELNQYYLRDIVATEKSESADDAVDHGDGSIMIVVATDAPLGSRNLERLASRALMGLARTGSPATNGSGDYVIAFSTAVENPIRGGQKVRNVRRLSNSAMSPLFLAAVEATEEAIYNSLFRATTVTGRNGNTVRAIPLDKTVEILRRYNAVTSAHREN